MSRLIRMDRSGHTTLAEWSSEDPSSVATAAAAFRAELEQGYYGLVSHGEAHAEQVRELPVDASLVILRRPIAGG
jgi:mRNA-degrading endonuclease toxin of MazEF toxin-antitoxin module